MNDDVQGILGSEGGLIAAWALPTDGPLDADQRKAAMANFKGYVERHGLTLRDVAQQVHRPKEVTILDLSWGVYGQTADADIRVLNNWVEQHARQQAVAISNSLVDTGVAKAIKNIARATMENGTMGLIVGPTGIGKTRCAVALAETIAGSVMVTVGMSNRHASSFMSSLAAALGVRRRVSPDQRKGSLIERCLLTLKNSSRLIILDEAHKLSASGLECVREVHDATGCPFLLFATKELQERIERNADPDHGQQFSRFDIVHALTRGKDAYSGGKGLFTVDEIKALYERPPIRLAKDAERYLLDIANRLGWGSLRRTKILVRNGARRARVRLGRAETEAVTIQQADLEWCERVLRPDSTEQPNGIRRKTAKAG